MQTAERIDTETAPFRAKLEAAFEKAKDTCERWQEKTAATARATDKALREHPYQAFGIAFGAGVLLGVLISRRWRD